MRSRFWSSVNGIKNSQPYVFSCKEKPIPALQAIIAVAQFEPKMFALVQSKVSATFSRFRSSVRTMVKSSGAGTRLAAYKESKDAGASRSPLPGGAAFDSLFVVRTLEDGVDEDAGSMNLIGVELAEFHELFDFGDHIVGSGGHHGIEVARGLAVDEIAPAVTFPSFDEGEIASDGALHDVLAAVEFASFFSVSHHGAVSRGRVERGYAGATGAEALAEGALWIQFHLQCPAENELLEELVFTDVGGDHFFDLAPLEQQADAEIVDAGVVADDGQVLYTFAADSSDEVFWDATQTEAAHEDGCAVVDLLNGGVGGGDAFVHTVLRSVRGSLLHQWRSWKTPQVWALVAMDAKNMNGHPRPKLPRSCGPMSIVFTNE